MIYELRMQEVADPTLRDEYMEVYGRALRAANLPGCHGGMIMKCVEDPTKVVVLIGWDSVEAHRSCTKTEAHAKFRETYMPYRTGPSTGGHYIFQEI
jgi:heme-degrading monooxygenase HmoA